MSTERLIYCGGLKPKGGVPSSIAALNLWPLAGDRNVNLDILPLNQRFSRTVPPRFYDLLEIASYVFAGDQMFSRGKIDVDNFGGRWRRAYHYHIPVREEELWNSIPVKRVLRETLEFLSDDLYDFEFYPAGGKAPQMQEYFRFDTAPAAKPIDQVMMFSGGLDSLAGAIVEAIDNKRTVALIKHSSTGKFNTTYQELERRFREKASPFVPQMVQLTINKDKELGKEHHQRARSFLYVALGGISATMLGLRHLRFYENGVLSLNLPVCGQVVGARSTRTTHPRVLAGFEKLLTLLTESPFVVENPFIGLTKGDVVRRIVDAGCDSLIPYSRSCAHTWSSSNDEPQCGTCSQCLDRRIAMLAAKADLADPVSRYKIDMFTQARPKDEDKILGAAFIERGSQIGAMRDAEELLCRYPEILRALPFIGPNNTAAAAKVFKLFKKHALEVKEATVRLLSIHAEAILMRKLPGDCLLRSVCESGSVTSTPVTPAEMAPLAPEGDEPNDPKGPKYQLRMELGVWTLVFDGKSSVLADSRAVRLVAYLLKNPPDEPIHATELENRVDGNPLNDGLKIDREDASSDDSVGGVIQEASGTRLTGGISLPELREKLSELKSDIENDELSEVAREEARTELAELLNAQGQGGKLVGAAEKSVDRVRKSIKNLIRELNLAEASQGKANAVLRGFGAHLHQSLWLPSMGGKARTGAAGRPGCFTYEPPNGVIWKD